MRTYSKILGCLLVGVVILAGAYLTLRTLAMRSFQATNQPYYGKVAAIKVGMTEAEVLKRLGKPDHTYTAANAPQNYYVSGYSFKRRPIEGKVLIYLGGTDLIAYLYIDPNGKVQDEFIGGS